MYNDFSSRCITLFGIYRIKKTILPDQEYGKKKSGPAWARTMDPLIMSQML